MFRCRGFPLVDDNSPAIGHACLARLNRVLVSETSASVYGQDAFGKQFFCATYLSFSGLSSR